MSQQIREYFISVIEEKYGIKIEDFDFDTPPKRDLGDLAFACFLLARELKKSPAIIAEELAETLSIGMEKPSSIEKVAALGPYINITFSGDSYVEDFLNFTKTAHEIEKKEENIVIDYIGANVGKPLHIGHMCTPTQGQAIINVYKRLGYGVISDSHIGDWGIIFGKLIRAYQEFGSEEKLHEDAVEHLFDLYVKITKEVENKPNLEQEFRDTFKKLSEGNSELVALWKDFTKSSIDAMNIQLARLGVFTQYNIGESFYEGIGLPKMEDYPDLEFNMKDIVKELIEKGIATQNDDNSVGIEFPEATKIPSCILQKRDGTHGYLASDLACIKYRMGNWSPDSMLYFNDMRQQLHFRQVFFAAQKAGWLTRNQKEDTVLRHTYNGFITLKDGAMSTRKGKIIKLNVLLDEAEERAKKIIQEKRDDIDESELRKLAKVIGIGAVKYGYLKKTRESDVVFDWDEFMTFEGNSGPYIQYSYVRARNILEKAGNVGKIGEIPDMEISPELKDLMLQLMKYHKILKQTAEEAHPHILTGYCYDIARSFNTLYNNENILSEESEEYKKIKICTIQTYSAIIKEAFTLLAIEMPEKM